MSEPTRPLPLPARPRPSGLRSLAAASGLCALSAALGLSPAVVKSLFLSAHASLDARDVACLDAVRGVSAALGLALLGVAASWHRLFRRPSRVPALLFLAPVAVLAALLASKVLFFGGDPPFYRWLTREDSVVEWLTWAAYCGTAVLAAGVSGDFRSRRRPMISTLYAALAITLFLVAMEEISWGQRLLDLHTPAALAANAQGELNVHNLPQVQRGLHHAYIAVGLGAGLAWIALPALRRMGGPAWLGEITPPWTLATWFLPVALVYGFYELATPLPGPDGQLFFGCFTWADQEVVEMLLAFGFLLFVSHTRRRLRAAGPSA